MKHLVPIQWLLGKVNELGHRHRPDCRFDLQDPAAGKIADQQERIPGAIYFDLEQNAVVHQHGGRHPLPDPEQLADKLGPGRHR